MARGAEGQSDAHGAPCVSRPVRAVRLAPAEVTVTRRQDGAILLRSPRALGAYPHKITERLEYWARAAPDRVFMAQREATGGRLDRETTGGWRSITYAQTLARVRRIGQSLLGRGLSAQRPIVILSGSDLEHALLGLAANYVGIPYAPVSPAYALVSRDYEKLKAIVALLTPGLVFAADGGAYAAAIEAALPRDIELVVVRDPVAGRPVTPFADLEAAAAGPDVEAAHAGVGPDTIAKFLFTSGSTGTPKAVVNTQRMWCSNQEMLRASLAYFQDEPPVIVDWAPWHHTAGGNHDVGLVLYNGGTLYIDDGKPLPGAIEATVRNLREIAPTWYFNVPKGYEALLPYLRADAALRETFFSRLKVLWFAGAGVAQHVFDAVKDLAFETCGERILFLTGLGSTETAPYAFGRLWEADDAANVGLPAPGLDVKLVPCEDRQEARLRGPSITPGYWRRPDLTAQAFDDEGYYRLGDALALADPARPEQGLRFEGRIAEDFKLASGTWVHVAALRAAFIARFAPLVRDVVLAAPDRDDLAALVFPDIEACRALAGRDCGAGAADVLADPRVREEFRVRLDALAATATGGSNRIDRLVLLETPPSLDAGEMTDKGSLNQRAVLRHRAEAVGELYARPFSPRIVAMTRDADETPPASRRM